MSSFATATASISASAIPPLSSARRSSSVTPARRQRACHHAQARRLGSLRQFDDQRFAIGGRLLADPAGSGVPIQHRGNYGFYAVIDQQLYRPNGGDARSGISVFSRMSLSPSDRNPIDAYIDGGIVFAGLIRSGPTTGSVRA